MQTLKKQNLCGFAVCLMCALFLAGCGNMASKEEMAEHILREDSEFAAVLQKKSKVDSRIGQVKSQIKIEKDTFDGKVGVLRKEFNKKKKLLLSEIGGLKKILDPQREAIAVEKSRLKAELKSYIGQYKNVESMSKDARKLLESERGLELPASERDQWQERLSNLSRQSKGLNENILQLKEKLRTLKLKKHLLRH